MLTVFFWFGNIAVFITSVSASSRRLCEQAEAASGLATAGRKQAHSRGADLLSSLALDPVCRGGRGGDHPGIYGVRWRKSWNLVKLQGCFQPAGAARRSVPAGGARRSCQRERRSSGEEQSRIRDGINQARAHAKGRIGRRAPTTWTR